MLAFNVWSNASSQGMQSAGEVHPGFLQCLRADDTATPWSMNRERTAVVDSRNSAVSVGSATNESTRDAHGPSP